MKPIFPPPFNAEKAKSYEQILFEPRFQVALVALVAIVLYFSKLGGSGLATWDDCYYAQKAKEILATGDWLTMRFNGKPEFDNPPFFMWMLALSYKTFGVTEFAAKFPSALMGVLSVALTFVFVSYLYDNWVGFYAAFVLVTTTTFAKYARHAMMDVTLTFFVLAALFSLVLAVERKKAYFIVWAICVSISILIKSVLGLFPALIGVAYLFLTGNSRSIGSWQFFLSVVIIACFGGFWHIQQILTHGRAFIDVHFKWLLFERGFVENPLPWYHYFSYVKDLLIYYWPWLPFAVFGLVLLARQLKRRNTAAILVIVWIVAYIGIMSVMNARKVWYVMPVFAALALAAGVALDSIVPLRKRNVAAKLVFVVFILSFLVMNLTPVRADMERQKDVRIVAPYVKYFADGGAKVIGFGFDYRSLNNPLLFYSDHSATPVFKDAERIAAVFEEPGLVLCVANANAVARLYERVERYYVIRAAGEIVLVSNRNADASAVPE